MEIDWELLQRYLAGDCAPEERERFEAWLAESPVHRQVVHELREVAVQSRRRVAPEREEQLLAQLKQRLEPAAPPLRAIRVLPRPMPQRSRWVARAKAAAVAALLVGGGAATYLIRSDLLPTAGSIADPAMRVVTTPAGQRAAFNLPDGSRVILGVASTIEYPAAFGTSRNVRLKGEAYFEVEHDEERPFVVRAGDLVATDLGTEFVVRAYAEDQGGRVVVREGKVGLRSAAAPADAPERILEPGELGRLSTTGDPIVERVDPEAHLAWTEGRLVFEGAPLSEVVVELGRWFDVEFQLADSALASRDLYASFDNQSLTSVLNEIAPTLRLRYEQRGRVIILRPLDAAR